MKVIKNIEYATNVHLDIYSPDIVNATLLFFHGGGIESGDKSDADVFAQYLCDNGVAVVSANYSMYPQAKYPQFITDAAKAAAFVYNNAEKYKISKNIFISGSSAGAYLSLMLCFAPEYLAEHSLCATDFKGFIFNAGQPTAHFNVLKRERGIDPLRCIVDESAPLFHVGRQKAYPPTLIITATQDMPNRHEQNQLLKAMLRNYGITNCRSILVEGTHCSYDGKVENGIPFLGKTFYDFIKEVL